MQDASGPHNFIGCLVGGLDWPEQYSPLHGHDAECILDAIPCTADSVVVYPFIVTRVTNYLYTTSRRLATRTITTSKPSGRRLAMRIVLGAFVSDIDIEIP